MTNPARIIFAGSPEFAVPPLEELLDGPHEVVAVLTQPDRPAGRGRKIAASPVKTVALENGLSVLQPESLSDESIQQQLKDLEPDLMVVVAYGLLLPKAVLDIPHRGCVNLHASLLPRWRGASPMQAAILAGDDQTGISLMHMDAGLDTGPVYAKSLMEINPRDTASSLHDRLAERGGRMLGVYIDDILSGSLQHAQQPDTGATYAGRIKKQDGHIDWGNSAEHIDRQIRAYNPWPAAQTKCAGASLRCVESAGTLEVDSAAKPGEVLGLEDDGLHIQTGHGVLVLTKLQVAGRKPVSAKDFANANDLEGLVLGN